MHDVIIGKHSPRPRYVTPVSSYRILIYEWSGLWMAWPNTQFLTVDCRFFFFGGLSLRFLAARPLTMIDVGLWSIARVIIRWDIMGVAFQGFVLVPVLKGCLLLFYKLLVLKTGICRRDTGLQFTQVKNTVFVCVCVNLWVDVLLCMDVELVRFNEITYVESV
jgi:hypothetical protein